MDLSRTGGAIFAENVRCPDPRGIWRARLQRRLSGPDAPTTGLVLGPPGSGKTTLLALLARRQEPVGAWYRASSDDTDEAALVGYLAAALGLDGPAYPGAEAADPDGPRLRDRSHADGDAGSPGSEPGTPVDDALGAERALVRLGPQPRNLALPLTDTPRTVDDLVRRLEALLPTSLLVVDDLHVLSGTPAERALERFVLLRPRALRVVLGSRRPPQLNTSRMLAAGELCQLDGDDLRFRSWEVEELFRVLHGRPLGPEAAAALTRRTGGWAAGLQLFHLATAEMTRHQRDHAVAELTGRSRLIRSYLTRNVLDGLPPQRRRFLVRTAALGVLTSDLCDELLDASGSADVLDELERHQFFTTSTDGVTFRYHQVLQTHLEVLLVDELGGQAARTLYARAAGLLERAGRLGAASRAYARAEDWGSVGRLAQQTHAVLPSDDDCAGLPSGTARAGTDDPVLAVVAARRLLRQGRVDDAVTAFTHAESLMDDPEFRDRCAQERAVAGLWLPATPGRSSSAGEAVRLALAGTSAEAALLIELRELTRDLSDPYAHRHPLAVVVGLLFAGRTDEAAGRVPSVLALDGRETAPWVRLVAQLAAVVADQVVDPDESGAAALEQVVLGADLEGLPWVSRLARGVQAALLVAVRSTPWRAAACADLLSDAERRRDGWSEVLLSLLVGYACSRAGDDSSAVRPLQRAVELAERLDAPVLGLWAEVLLAGPRVRLAGVVDATPEGTAARPEAAEPEALAGLRRRARTYGIRADALLPAQREHAQPEDRQLKDPQLGAERPDPGWAGSHTMVNADSRTGPGTAGGDDDTSIARRQPRVEPSARLRCLGSFELLVAGVPVDWRRLRPRARSLLQLLALHHGRAVHRERLIDAIWPDAGATSGTRSLQVAASSIRQCLLAGGLPDGCLHRHGDAYALELPGVTSDVARFEELRAEVERLGRVHDLDGAAASRAAAVTMYAGELLPELGSAEWVVEERDRLRTQAAQLAADAASAALIDGDLAAAVGFARRSIDIDPYRDSPWLSLTAALERLGDRAAAEVARRDHRRSLAALGLGPVTDPGRPGPRPAIPGPALATSARVS